MITSTALQSLIDDPAKRSEVSAVEMATAFLDRMGRLHDRFRAFITETPELAIRGAERVDAARRRGRRLPLDGMPIAIKDNIDVAGIPTTVGSRSFEHSIAVEHAEAVRLLAKAGAVILGKTNLHELVFGATTDNPYYGTCRNPWNPDHSPGGSSGGSAVAIAADLCVGALGSDTGGSIRLPSAFVGVTGLRPSFGRISNRGTFPVSWSFDVIGPMARSVRDVAALLIAMNRYDKLDSCAVRYGRLRFTDHNPGSLRGLRAGLPDSYFFEGIDPEVERLVREGAVLLSELGIETTDVHIPDILEAVQAASLVNVTEALAVHQRRLHENPQAFSRDIRERLQSGESVTGTQYVQAMRTGQMWRRTMHTILETDADVMLTPTSGWTAPTIEEGRQSTVRSRMPAMTYPWSLASLPSLSLPCGVTAKGLPVGMQLSAAPGKEMTLIRIGLAYQSVTDWHRLRAPLVGAVAD